MELRDFHLELVAVLLFTPLKVSPLVAEADIADIKKFVVPICDITATLLFKNLKLQVIIKLLPLSLHLAVYFLADLLVRMNYGLVACVLADLFIVESKGFVD